MKNVLLNILFLLAPIMILCQDISVPINYYKALGYRQYNNNDSALLILSNCQNNPSCKMLKAEILYKNGDFNSALNELKRSYDISPEKSSILLARIYSNLGFAEESVYWLEKHFEHKNVLSYSEIISFDEFDQINRSSEWRKFWDTPHYSKNVEKLYEADYLIKTGDYNQAIKILEAESFGSREYIKNTLLAKIYYDEGTINAALRSVNLALADKPNYDKALELKYLISVVSNNYTDAYNVGLNLIRLSPENPENLLRYTESCLMIGKNIEALKYVNIYCNCFPKNEEALYLKTRILVNEKDYRNALISLNKLVLLNPSKKEYFVLRGTAYYNLESWQFAREDFAMALDIDPKLVDVMYMTGVCWHELGFDSKACRWWQKAAGQNHRNAAKMLFRYCN